MQIAPSEGFWMDPTVLIFFCVPCICTDACSTCHDTDMYILRRQLVLEDFMDSSMFDPSLIGHDRRHRNRTIIDSGTSDACTNHHSLRLFMRLTSSVVGNATVRVTREERLQLNRSFAMVHR